MGGGGGGGVFQSGSCCARSHAWVGPGAASALASAAPAFWSLWEHVCVCVCVCFLVLELDELLGVQCGCALAAWRQLLMGDTVEPWPLPGWNAVCFTPG